MLIHEELTSKIIAAAVKVHSTLGPGLLESVYEACLAHELAKVGLAVQRQVPVPIVYDGVRLDCGFRADLIVEGVVVIELKAIDRLAAIHEAQLMTYLKLSSIKVGLILNFNQLRVTDGMIRRAV
jgi:GxxExxY protein